MWLEDRVGKTLYLECNAGISGDMTVAALLDLGADKNVLDQVLASLPVDGYKIEYRRVKKSGLDCMDFSVILDEIHENHDHDMNYLHGHSHEEHEHHHEHSHEDHGHHHEHNQNHHHHHEHRGMNEIIKIIDAGNMTENAKRIAKQIFDVLAKAEAKAHGVAIEDVHFHEVGAIDSIVDIISVAVCIDNLNITDVIVPKLCEGTGTIRCQHGILSIPVPATANIMEMYHLPVEFMNVQGEFITPTGAAIVAALKTADKLPSRIHITKIGMGAGKRNYERASILRAMLLEKVQNTDDEIVKLEANIDDCSGEVLGYTLEKLMAAGARDVHYIPVYMKKNRPGYQLNVICDEEKIDELEHIIFRETTTIGIRKCKMQRQVMEREIMEVDTKFGKVLVKKCTYDDIVKCYPECESVVKLAKENNVSFDQIVQEIKLY